MSTYTFCKKTLNILYSPLSVKKKPHHVHARHFASVPLDLLAWMSCHLRAAQNTHCSIYSELKTRKFYKTRSRPACTSNSSAPSWSSISSFLLSTGATNIYIIHTHPSNKVPRAHRPTHALQTFIGQAPPLHSNSNLTTNEAISAIDRWSL